MKIRTRIFLVFVLVVVGGFYFLVRWIGGDLRPRYLESLEEPLVDTAYVLAELLADPFTTQKPDLESLRQAFQRIYERRFSAQIYGLEKSHVDMRVYVTDQQGIVLFDSDERGDEGKDYSNWNDVYLSLQGRYGARSSQEDPLNPESSVLYIAAPIYRDGEIVGVVSVGKPARNADQFIALAKQKLAVGGLVAAASVLGLGLVLYAWVSLPLERLTRYAQAVKAGERVALPRFGRNEIGMMGDAIEEMREALDGKDYVERYVQTLTHELKSPLAAIRGAAELLQEDMEVDQRQRFLSNIRTETQRLQNLVDRLLELAALEKRQGLENVTAIEWRALLNDVINSLAPLATLKNVAIQVSRTVSPSGLTGERFLLRQALTNLLRNALEFSPDGGQVIIVSKVREAELVTMFLDQGPGIPEYALSRVFERFYSLKSPHGSSKGTGLGLSFAKEVAELHGGTITLTNREQGGAVAVLRLPLSPGHRISA
ncbi:MAG: two-component system sensor histidine kinase CreC [Candidatus Competibacteraceae bacterium]|nr:two-component system sensor histidine kinase CreC [Candidatus Competibacteraceae bacterium]